MGGMNHFMLPESSTGQWGDQLSAAMRYGNFAMEALINAVLKSGCAPEATWRSSCSAAPISRKA